MSCRICFSLSLWAKGYHRWKSLALHYDVVLCRSPKFFLRCQHRPQLYRNWRLLVMDRWIFFSVKRLWRAWMQAWSLLRNREQSRWDWRAETSRNLPFLRRLPLWVSKVLHFRCNRQTCRGCRCKNTVIRIYRKRSCRSRRNLVPCFNRRLKCPSHWCCPCSHHKP